MQYQMSAPWVSQNICQYIAAIFQKYYCNIHPNIFLKNFCSFVRILAILRKYFNNITTIYLQYCRNISVILQEYNLIVYTCNIAGIFRNIAEIHWPIQFLLYRLFILYIIYYYYWVIMIIINVNYWLLIILDYKERNKKWFFFFWRRRDSNLDLRHESRVRWPLTQTDLLCIKA